MKTCKRCGEERKLDDFPRKAQTGKYKTTCKPCRNADARNKYSKDEEHRRKLNQKNKEAFQNISEEKRARLNEAKRRARICGLHGYKPAKHDAHVKEYYREQAKIKKDQSKLQTKLYDAHVKLWKKAKQSDAYRHKYRNNPEFNAKEKIRARLRKLEQSDSEIARLLANKTKRGGGDWNQKWRDLLGYSMPELISHLHKTLPKRCTWKQFLEGDLHIDHIVPRAEFDMTKPQELKACWSLANLRLIHARDNRAKGAKRLYLL